MESHPAPIIIGVDSGSLSIEKLSKGFSLFGTLQDRDAGSSPA